MAVAVETVIIGAGQAGYVYQLLSQSRWGTSMWSWKRLTPASAWRSERWDLVYLCHPQLDILSPWR